MKSLSLLAAAIAVSHVAAIPAEHPLIARAISKMEKRQGGFTSMVNGMFNREFKTDLCIIEDEKLTFI
jgi:hypothetical protein